MNRTISLAIASALLLASHSYSAAADAARTATAEQPPITFAMAAGKTLRNHPGFRHFTIAIDAARIRESQAQLKPGLELSGNLENVLGSGSVSGAKGAELTVSLASVFERGNKRAARLDLAQSAGALLSVEQRIDALDLLTETGRQFVALAAAQEARAAAERALILATTTLDAIKVRVRAAQAPETEQLNAQIVQAEAMLQVGNAKRSMQAAQHTLGLSWNEPGAQPVVVMELYAMPKPAAPESLALQIDALPDIAQYSAQTRLAHAQLNLSRANASSDWRWSAGLRRLERDNDQAFVVGMSIPLGQAKRQSGFVQEAQINTQLPELAAQATRLKLKSLLVLTIQDMSSAIAEEHVIRGHQLPQAKQVMTLTMRGYDIGRYAYRDVALAQAQVQSLEHKRLNAAQAYHLSRIELERLTGAQLNLISE